MFEMTKLLHPLSSKNKEYHEASWYTSGMPFKKEIICKAINYSLPESSKEEVEEKYREYRGITPE